MGRNKQVSCKICFKSMRSDTVTRHMKIHLKNIPNRDDIGSWPSLNKYIDFTECTLAIGVHRGHGIGLSPTWDLEKYFEIWNTLLILCQMHIFKQVYKYITNFLSQSLNKIDYHFFFHLNQIRSKFNSISEWIRIKNMIWNLNKILKECLQFPPPPHP